jgi:large conductance mechanosensitive channel
MGFLKEFKEFISRGNVVDLAVGVIIGAAFGAITTSLVNDIIMPPVGLALAGVDFSKLHYVLKEAHADETGKMIPAVSINYGAFIQTLINFLIIAFSVFVLIRVIHSMRKKREEEETVSEAPTAQEALLTDIRDILNQINTKGPAI